MSAPGSRAKLFGALAVVYVVWGSTYLAIRFAIETIPPFLMAGARFLGAGALLYAWARSRGEPGATRAHLVPSLVGGALMMLLSNGLVTWSETRVDSALAALIVGCVPLWMLLADWWLGHSGTPRPFALAGVLLGIGGVVVLVWPSDGAASAIDPHGVRAIDPIGAGAIDPIGPRAIDPIGPRAIDPIGPRAIDPIGPRAIDPIGALALVVATLSWTAGSLYTRSLRPGPSALITTASQMIAGGALQMLAGVLLGELASFDLASVTARSAASWLYLMTAGSLVGFTAYAWLLRNSAPALASSYAFVNPLVALLLGTAFAGERLAPRALLASGAIVVAVVLVVLAGRRRAARA